MIRALVILLLLCSPALAFDGRQEIVLVIWDDIGAGSIAAYGEPDAVLTPTIDEMATSGQLYLNMTSQPMCTPTRRDIFYGMTPLQHGAGRAWGPNISIGPWAERLSLVSSMQAAGWQVGIIGKLHAQEFGEKAHLGNHATQTAAMGFDFTDALLNQNSSGEYPATTGSPHAAGNHHYSWIEIDGTTGVGSINTTYTTDAITTAAVTRLQNSDDLSPMLLIVSYSAAHSPQNPPPGEVGSCAATTSSTAGACYDPAIEYLDTKLQDIVDEMDYSEDILIVLGDNGRAKQALDGTYCDSSTSKSFANPCGTRVPMAIQGVGITAYDYTANEGVPALLNTADLHDTLLDLAGGTQYREESISFTDCFANPSTCAPRVIASAIIYEPTGRPVPAHNGEDFTKYQMHFLIENATGTVLYGMQRVYDDANNDVDTFTDVLYDLGSPSTIDETKRYAPDAQIISSPAGEQLTAQTAMQAEATRLIEARWAGPPQTMIGVTLVGAKAR